MCVCVCVCFQAISSTHWVDKNSSKAGCKLQRNLLINKILINRIYTGPLYRSPREKTTTGYWRSQSDFSIGKRQYEDCDINGNFQTGIEIISISLQPLF